MSESALVRTRTYELSLEQPSLFQDIRERCWDEVHRRLSDDPASVSTPSLVRLFIETSKIQLHMANSTQQVDESKSRSILDAISGLPPGRQLVMLEQAIAMLDELGEDSSAHKHLLAELRGEQNGATAEAADAWGQPLHDPAANPVTGAGDGGGPG